MLSWDMSTSTYEQRTLNLLLDKMEDLRREKEIKDKELSDLKEENELLKSHLMKFEEKNKELLEEKSRYQNECTRLCLLVSKLNEDIITLKEENLKLDSENDAIAKDYSCLNREFDRLKKRVQELEARQHLMVQVQATPSSRPNEISLTSEDLIDSSNICSPSSGQPTARRQSVQSIDNGSSSVISTQSLEEGPTELSLDVLMRELSDNAADKWRQIGIQLKISSSRLNSIDNNYKNDIDKLSEILQLWLDNDSYKSWNMLCDTLQSSPVKCSDLAESLRKKYCQ